MIPIHLTEGFFGVEFEMENGGFSHSNAKKLLNIANIDHELLYIKSDSSLEDGFDLVSHALSMDKHVSMMPWKELLNEAIKMGYLSHR